MKTRLICASHSPLMYCYKKEPEHWGDLQAAFNEQKQAIESFDPELVIAFGSDHFNGFFLRLMPAFCIGLKAEAVADIGGFPGKLDVPGDLAAQLTESLRADNLDPAVSYEMTVDHAFSQTIQLMLGGLDKNPLIPIFINCINKPFVPFQRSRLFGTAVGEWAKRLNKRVLFLASGGLSHHPTRYYPAWGDGEKPVAAWQLSGGDHPDSLTKEQWLKRLNDMHHEGAEMIAGGTRTAKDMYLNADADKQFLDTLTSGKLDEFDQWDQDEMVSRAGIGSMEQHTWIAASAAHLACGGDRPSVRHYSVALEIGIAAGVAFAE